MRATEISQPPWHAPDPKHAVPCPFGRCWIGVCKETDRSKCLHGKRWDSDPKKRATNPARDVRCSCGRPAMGECEMAGSFVCGAPICKQFGMCHTHGGSHG